VQLKAKKKDDFFLPQSFNLAQVQLVVKEKWFV